MADIDGKLLFTAPADGSGRLVFGYEGDSSAAPGAELGVDGDFPEMDGVTTLVIAYDMAVDGDFPAMEGDVGLQYDSGVFRGTRVGLEFSWQEAVPVEARLATAWQVSEAHVARLATSWQAAMPLAARVDVLWQETERLQARLATAWQNAEPLSTRLALAWQETIRLESRLATDWQEAVPVSTRLDTAWQETLHLSALMDARWQQAIPTRTELRTSFGDGRLVARRLDARWQEATWPRSGVSLPPVIAPPEKELCYDPATVARLVFSESWDGAGKLLFICLRKDGGTDPEPGETLVVPLKRVYMAVHEIDAILLPSGERVEINGIVIEASDDNFGWRMTASGGLHLMDQLACINGLPRRVQVTIDGFSWVFAINPPERSRKFGERRVAISGMSVTSLLGDPFMPAEVWSNTLSLSAQQIVLNALDLTGVALDWGIEDWVVPANAWSHQGTPLSVVTRIAEAAGAVVRSDRQQPKLYVAPRYPFKPWQWFEKAPQIRMPAQLITMDSLQSLSNGGFDGVHVRGQTGAGVHAFVVRAGTQGAALASDVTDPLITSIEVARMRGESIIGSSVMAYRQVITVPLLSELGLVSQGQLVEVVEPSETWRGVVKGVTVSESMPSIRQAIVLERFL